MKIIPAIDILNGKCVRLSQGDYNTSAIYNASPLEVAISMEAHGLQYLHLVDLDGAKSGRMVHLRLLQEISTHTRMKIDYGGGIKSTADVQRAFDCGAAQITAGSIAVSNPSLVASWIQHFGADRIILGADCRNRKIATHGWQQSSELDILQFISEYCAKGMHTVICTDIDLDGMLQGSSVDLYRDILSALPVNLIASGGVSSLADLEALKSAGCAGAIIGKAIYEQRITLKELSRLC